IRQWPLSAGEMFTEQDERGATKVAVLGPIAATELFGEDDPIGQSVRIANVPFTVVGVLVPKGTSAAGYDQDDNIIIPFGTMSRQLIGKQTGVRRIYVQAASLKAVNRLEKDILTLLRQHHRITGSSDEEGEDFKVTS